jgi:hypothetical protein
MKNPIKNITQKIRANLYRPTYGFLAMTRYVVQRRLLVVWHWQVTDNDNRLLQSGWAWTHDAAMREASHWANCLGFQARRGI